VREAEPSTRKKSAAPGGKKEALGQPGLRCRGDAKRNTLGLLWGSGTKYPKAGARKKRRRCKGVMSLIHSKRRGVFVNKTCLEKRHNRGYGGHAGS